MDKIIEILRGVKEDVDYENEDQLIDDEIIDSLELMEIISELEDEFGISIEMDDITPQNFNSAETILALVKRLREE